MADNEIRNPSKAYFKWKMPVITKSEDDWNFWNTEDKYNRTMFIGYNDTATPHVASLFMIVDGKPMQAVGDDVIARIAGLETSTAQALADIQALIDRVNAQQTEISNLQQECERILAQAADTVLDAQIWAEGTDAQVAEKGGEHSAKGWAQKANDIVASGLPSDVTFDHLTVTGSSKFGQDPDRENQPGLEIEGTGEIQAYRTVNMYNGGTIEYDGTVDMPWSDSSNKIPNTEWVQKAVRHGSVDPDSDLTVNSITATGKGASLTYKESDVSEGVLTVGSEYSTNITMSSTVYRITTLGREVYTQGKLDVSNEKITMEATGGMTFTADTRGLGNDAAFMFKKPIDSTRTANFYVLMPAHLQDGLFVGNAQSSLGLALNISSENRADGKLKASFGVTPTVPDITDTADSSDKVPNTKWVQEAISAGGSASPVLSVNGKTGEVVLEASDIGAATADDITAALEPYAKTADVTVSLADYAKSADVTTEIATATAGLQPKLTAGTNITISEDNVISATGGGSTGGAVDSVNGKTGTVVLTGEDIKTDTEEGASTLTGALNAIGAMLPSGVSSDNQLVDNESMTSAIESALTPYATTEALNATVAPLATTASVDTALAGKQDTLDATKTVTVKSITAAMAGTGQYATTLTQAGFTTTNTGTGHSVVISNEDGSITCSNTWSADENSTRVGNTKWTQRAIDAKVASLQPKLTAGDGITISDDNVISATGGSGGGDVASVNGKTGAVVLTAEDIALSPSDATTVKANSDALSVLVLSKQDALTTTSDIAVNSVKATAFSILDFDTAELKLSADATSFLANQGNIQLGKDDNAFGTMNGTWFINNATMLGYLSGPHVAMTRGFLGQLQGGSAQDETGAFDWYMNNTTDYNKFNIYSRRWVTSTDATTGESTTTAVDTQVMSAGGSPDNGSTWIDFTADYLSFKGAANFGEAGMSSHTMNFNGQSTFLASATFKESFTLSINEYGEYSDGISWMPRKNASTFGLTARAPIYIDGWDTTAYTSNLVKLRGCGLTMTDSTGTNTFFKLVTNDSIGQLQMTGSMFLTGAGNLLHVRQGAGIVVQDANLSVLMDTTVAGQINFDSNVRLGTTAYDITDDSGNVTEHVNATDVWVNGNGLFYSGLTCMASAPASFMADATFYKVDSEGGATPAATFTASTGSFGISRVDATDGSNGANRLAWDADSRNTDTYGMHINMPVSNAATMPAASDSSTTVPTTAWVQSAIAAGGVPENLSVKSLKVTEYDSSLDSIAFAGNLKYTGDAGNSSLGKIYANELHLQSPGYYSTFVRQSGITLTSGTSGTEWFKADSSASKLTVSTCEVQGAATVGSGMVVLGSSQAGSVNCTIGTNGTAFAVMLADLTAFSISAEGTFVSYEGDIATDNATKLAATGGVRAAINNAKPAAAFSISGSAQQVIRSETCSDGSKLCTVYWHGPATNGTAIDVTVPSAVSNGIVASVVITPEAAGTAGASATLTDTTLSITPALATDGNVSITVVLYHEA